MDSSRTIFIVALIQALIVISESQKILPGKCSRTHVVQDFDVSRYLGKWYEIKKIPNVFQRGICTEANYGPINQWGQVAVLNKEVQNQRVVAVEGVAIQDKMHHGDLQVILRVPIVGEQRSSYDVLATDYENYAVVHACKPLLRGLKIEFGWILSRQRNMDIQKLAELDQILERNGVDSKNFQITLQDGCPNLDLMPFKLIA